MNNTIYNRKKYYDFFKWHRFYSLQDPSESPETDNVCTFCAFLNELKKEHFKRTVSNICNFFDDEQCTSN